MSLLHLKKVSLRKRRRNRTAAGALTDVGGGGTEAVEFVSDVHRSSGPRLTTGLNSSA